MTGRLFAVLSFFVLIALSSFVVLTHSPNFNTSAVAVVEFQNNPVPMPVFEHTSLIQRSARFDAMGDFDRLRPISRLGLPFLKFVSWSHEIKSLVDMPLIQENCLTTAVYFEARSESKLGQLAVATVILNRVQANPSSSICGVVYRGANQLNSCQFSFACDGKPDIVEDVGAWQTAVEVTALALATDITIGGPMQVLATATNYHADFVNPGWSKSLYRLAKIGRHIFYSQSPRDGTVGSRKNYI